MNDQPTPLKKSVRKELRIKGSDAILSIIKSFSATEKVIFSILAFILFISMIVLATRVNIYFLVAVPTQGGQLDEGVIGLPRLINPVLAFSDVDKDITNLVYAGLMKYDSRGNLLPDLAQSYTVSPDGLTYTFTLKDNTYFNDGSRVTADDVVFTIQKIQDQNLKSPRRADWTSIAVTKLNDTQVQFTLKQPYAPFLGNTTVGILPKHIWGNVSTDEFIFSQYNIQPIGAGPYQFSAITRDSGGIPTSISLVPFPRYQNNEAFISTIVIHFFQDDKKAMEAITNSTVQSLSTVDPADVQTIIAGSNHTKILTSTLPRIFAVFFNQNQNPVLANGEVRKALNMATDRNSIVKNVLHGYGKSIDSPIPLSFIPDATPATSTIDIAGAQALLKKAGWVLNAQNIFEKKMKTGTTTLAFSISTADSPDLVRTANMLKDEWTQLGADVDIRIFEAGDLTQNIINTRKYDALLFGESVGRDIDLYAYWHSSARVAPGLNISMYVNSQADKLLEDARSASSTQNRLADYAAFDDIIQTDSPAVFLYSPDFIYAVPDNVKRLELGQVSQPSDRWNDVSKWYIDTDNIWNIFTHNN